MADDNQSPEFNASFLFLVDLSIRFKNCSDARAINNPQMLLRNLESAALCLTGYYSKNAADCDKKQKVILQQITDIKRLLDKVLREYDESKDLLIPESLWLDMFRLEQFLRSAWKESGLQMSLKSRDELDEY